MRAILVVLTGSPILGFTLGFLHFSWVAIVLSGLALANALALLLQNQGLDLLPGLAIVASCFAVNQIAYQIGKVARPPDRH